jgi:hypothetical protein
MAFFGPQSPGEHRWIARAAHAACRHAANPFAADISRRICQIAD